MGIQFTGSGYFSYTNASNLPDCAAAKTITFWAYVSNNSGTQGWVNFTNSTLGCGYQIGVRSGSLYVWNYGGGVVFSQAITADSMWHHFAMTYNPTGTLTTMYIDGVSVGTSTTAVQSGLPDTIAVGGNQWSEYQIGRLADVRLYARVLSANEIQTMFTLCGKDSITADITYRDHFIGQIPVTNALSTKDVVGFRTGVLVGNGVTAVDDTLTYLRGFSR